MLLSLLGRTIAALPEGAVKGLCHFAGGILWLTPRGKLVRRNMRMALEIENEKELSRLSYDACCRTVELGLLGLAGQFFTDARWKKIITVSDATRTFGDKIIAEQRGILLLVPHTTLMEALTVLPLFFDPKRRMSVLYRSFASPAIEKAILGRREAHGVKLLSRDSGMRTLVHELREGQLGGLLFDQNSGEKGALISFMGRVAAASDLPDIVYRHSRAVPVALAIRRTGFWRGELVAEKLAESDTSLTILVHRWLEKFLCENKTDWLWTHNRWKVLNRPKERLGLNHREILEVPTQKKTKIFIRMPNWLGDVIMALPLLRALRQSRPDAEITLFCRSPYIPLLDKFGIADRILGVPKKPLKSFAYFTSFKKENPDFCLAFTNSLRGDIEMLMTGCKQRAGLKRQGYWRPLVNCGLKTSQKDLSETHQTKIWELLFKKLGLKTAVLYESFCLNDNKIKQNPIGFVAGSANEPAKRYPAEKWRELADKLQKKIVLFGTAGEQAITSVISNNLSFVNDLAGKTDMGSLAEEIAKCSLVIGNDTGAMHLANALGVPTIVLYGNLAKPERFHPIFTTPYIPLKAESNGSIAEIKVEEILSIIKEKFPSL